jgi:alpha-tubulin suppressor-like RCC1 family protein
MKIWLTTILRGFGLLAGIALAVPAASAASLAAGYDFAGSIDSTGVLRTWGDNDFGQLGQGSATTTSVSQPAPVAGSHHWSGVAMGQDFTLAFDTAGALWAWGNNTSGQLGIGGTATTSSPVKVSLPAGSVVQAVAAGQAFSVALVNVGADHGRIYAWGGNSYGQLGQGSADNNVHATPLWVGSTSSRRYTSITATGLAVVAIATDGSLWAWGDNSFGETGQGGTAGSPFNLSVPTQVGTATGWTSVSGGYGHVLALQGTALWAWGFNGEGQVGNGAVGPSVTTPTQIAATQSWAAVGAGQYHSFAVDSSGNLWAWGLNDYGELDLPISETTANEFSTPQATGLEPGLAPWSAVVGGEFFTVARNAAGGVYAVGDDTFGELGNDTINSALNFTPAFVQALVGGVNLTVAAPLVPSATLGVNAVAQPVTVTVQNTGSATETGSFVVGVYLSSDGVIDSGALLLASATQSPPLVSLGSVTVTFSGANLAIPGVPPGAYQLISQVTPVGGNPVNGGATAVTLVGPDLTFQSDQCCRRRPVHGCHRHVAQRQSWRRSRGFRRGHPVGHQCLARHPVHPHLRRYPDRSVHLQRRSGRQRFGRASRPKLHRPVLRDRWRL